MDGEEPQGIVLLEVSVSHRLLLAHPSLAILVRDLGASQHILQPH